MESYPLITDELRLRVKKCIIRISTIYSHVRELLPEGIDIDIRDGAMGYSLDGVWTTIYPINMTYAGHMIADNDGVHWRWNEDLDADLLARLKEVLSNGIRTSIITNIEYISAIYGVLACELDADYILTNESLKVYIGRFSDEALHQSFNIDTDSIHLLEGESVYSIIMEYLR